MPLFAYDWAAGYVSPFHTAESSDGHTFSTPDPVIEALLDAALDGCSASTVVVDLGSGDGRVVLAAARRGVDAIGIELNASLVEASRLAAKAENLSCRFEQESLLTAPLPSGEAAVLVAYLLPEAIAKLSARLDELQFAGRLYTVRWAPDASSCMRMVRRVDVEAAGGWTLFESRRAPIIGDRGPARYATPTVHGGGAGGAAR